ncbi:MAG: glycosyltransferase [Candidatus Daviesbacteria bacterium]|nr:glycosyltransferase [Candidatus Daviesbacteria bacterium]
MSKVGSLSVFFPAYNEAENIENTVVGAVKVLEDLKLDYEVIVVDDGSKDATVEIVRNLSNKNSQIRLVSHEKNLGYGSALKTGFKEAKYDWVAFTDSDGQFDFTEIEKFLEKTDEAEVILGYRLNRADTFIRKVFTFGWSTLANIFLSLNVKDYSCGFKLIKKEAFEKVQPLVGEEKVTQIELLVKARRKGYKFAEVGVHHFPRRFGTPTGAKISVVVKSIFDLFKLWWEIKEQKLIFVLVLGVLLLAAFLRFYRLADYMTFLGDEGRDALIIKGMLVDQNMPFIGPPTSVGNIYLGPLYYYMMALSMGIFWLNPVAAAGMNALIGVSTVLLIYWLNKKWFSRGAGLISAFLYAISPVTIFYSRSSWNPNPAPFFALIGAWAFYKSHTAANFKWLFLVGAASAAALNMHYLALILVPIFGIMWLGELISKRAIKNFWLGTIGAIIAFWVVMLPLVLFDFKHEFLNYRAIIGIFSAGESVNFSLLDTLFRLPNIYFHDLIGRYLAGENLILTLVVSILVLVPIILGLNSKFQKKMSWPVIFLGVWLFVGLIGLSFYNNSIYDHYLGFMNPVPYLLLGAGWPILSKINLRLAVVVFFALILSLSYVNLMKNPLLRPANYQLTRTQEIAKLVIDKSGGQPFNFALIAASNYDSAYQFYLGESGHASLQLPFNITDQLFVVCEDQICDPTHNAKYEIAGFGWSKIDSMEEYKGVRVYKLIPNPTGKP